MTKIDEVKKFWNRRPCNIKHSSKTPGTKEYFEDITKKKYFVEPHIPGFAQFEHWKGKKVLEIGCGLGTDTISFAQAGAIVTAIDLSEESLKMAKKRAEIFGVSDRITFYLGNAEKLCGIVPIETYDLIYAFGSIHHSPNPSEIVTRIKEYMGPQSELKVMVYNLWSYKSLWVLFKYGWGMFWKLKELVAWYSEAQEGSPVTYCYTKHTIKKLFKDFSVVDIKKEHIFSWSIPEYKEHKYVKAFPFNFIPDWFFKRLEKILGWHLCVTCKLKSSL